MKKRVVVERGIRIVVIDSTEALMTSVQSTLDVLATVSYEDDCDCMVMSQAAFAEAFFVLSSGLAGEVLQKFANYRKKLAIVGDFSGYTSKLLQDFMRECNAGRHVCFAATEQEGIAWLARA